MTVRRSNHLIGGLNEVLAPEQLSIEDGQVQDCNNYEHNDDGSLTLRTEPAQYDSGLTSAVLAVYGTKGIYTISEPFYPPNKPTDMDNEFMILTFGFISGSTYETHLWFQKSDNSWVKATSGTDHTAGLGTAGVAYTSASDVKFTIADDRIIITDGVNRAHYIQVNPDGEFVSGILGIPAPTNKATMTEYTTWKQEYWEENVGSDFLTLPGLVQVVYTAVTDDGEESNPSPISKTLDLQFFKKNSDSNDIRWINKVIINNLSIPDVSSNIKAKLKYFNIYLRTMQYAENLAASQFYFSQQVTIIDKTQTVAASGNSYTITVSPDLITPPSYENDIAPVAAESAYTGGIIMLGDIKTQLSFPHGVFKYYHKITVSNVNSQSYVDAVIRIDLTEAGMTSFEVDDWIDSSSPYHIKGENHIRIYDEDSTTPITVISCDTGSATTSSMKVLASMPQLKPGNNTLYLCFTPTADQGSYAGVTDAYYQSQAYGQFHDLDNGTWANQEVVNTTRQHSVDVTACSAFEFEARAGAVDDKTGNSDTVAFSGIASIDTVTESPSTAPYVGQTIGNAHIGMGSPTSGISYDFGDKAVINSGTTAQQATFKTTRWFRVKYFSAKMIAARLIYSEGSLDAIDGEIALLTYDDSGTIRPRLTRFDVSGGSSWSVDFNTLEFESASGNYEYLIVLSSDNSVGTLGELSMFIYDLVNSSFTEQKKDGPDTTRKSMFPISTPVDRRIINLGYQGYTSAIDDMYYDNFQRVNDLYLESGTADAENRMTQIANFMPPFETIIGYNWATTTDNANITFDTVDNTQTIEQKTRKNMLKYSDVNENSFPDLFYKLTKEPVLKIIPAPSFLQFEYGNTFIIFTRNFVLRFVLEGSASGWRASADSLIEEHKHFGLFDKNTLQRAGSALFWLSEQGVVQWDADGIKNISKNIVSIPFSTASLVYRSMFCHVNDQYWLHTTVLSGTTWVGTQYVYDIRKQVWTKFTDIGMRQAVVLTEGVAKDNINLILALNSGGTDNEIFSYPSSTNTTATAIINTPTIQNTNGFVKSFTKDTTGDGVTVKVHTNSKSETFTGQTDLNTTGLTAEQVTLSASETDFFGGTNANKIINDAGSAQHRAYKSDVTTASTKKIVIYARPSTSATYMCFKLTNGDSFNILVATRAVSVKQQTPVVTVTRLAGGWYKIEWTIGTWGNGVLQVACASSDVSADSTFSGSGDEQLWFHIQKKYTTAFGTTMENNKWRRVTPRRGQKNYLEIENATKLKSYGIEIEERGN